MAHVTLLVICAAALVAAAAARRPLQAAGSSSGLPAELLTRCVITQEAAAKADYSGIKAGCSLALDAGKCTQCPCALIDSLTNTLQSVGYDVDISIVTQADATVALQLCQEVLLPALDAAGVPLMSLLELAQCPAAESFSLASCPKGQ